MANVLKEKKKDLPEPEVIDEVKSQRFYAYVRLAAC